MRSQEQNFVFRKVYSNFRDWLSKPKNVYHAQSHEILKVSEIAVQLTPTKEILSSNNQSRWIFLPHGSGECCEWTIPRVSELRWQDRWMSCSSFSSRPRDWLDIRPALVGAGSACTLRVQTSNSALSETPTALVRRGVAPRRQTPKRPSRLLASPKRGSRTGAAGPPVLWSATGVRQADWPADMATERSTATWTHYKIKNRSYDTKHAFYRFPLINLPGALSRPPRRYNPRWPC